MTRCCRHNLYLSRAISKHLVQASVSPGVSQSAVVEAALRQFFDPDQAPQAVLVRRLDRHGRLLERQLHHIDLVLETLALFVQSYFNAVPPLAPAALEAQKALGARRFDAFIHELGRRMTGGGTTLVNDLLRQTPDPAAEDKYGAQHPVTNDADAANGNASSVTISEISDAA